jgi:ubiquinone/menaquinone biosynthesis C-methylase UbiE
MSTRELYNEWSATYDEVENKTRDLEKKAGQQMLATLSPHKILELGCGTGKNTEWLSQKASSMLSVDFSEGMLEKAKERVQAAHVQFQRADITQPWSFVQEKVDLITCSLILEHIEDLPFVMQQAANLLHPGGLFYICELHPYKQYSGSKARFQTAQGMQVLTCFVHHVSDYTEAALQNGLRIVALKEWFDEDDNMGMPRLISFLFQKP